MLEMNENRQKFREGFDIGFFLHKIKKKTFWYEFMIQ